MSNPEGEVGTRVSAESNQNWIKAWPLWFAAVLVLVLFYGGLYLLTGHPREILFAPSPTQPVWYSNDSFRDQQLRVFFTPAHEAAKGLGYLFERMGLAQPQPPADNRQN